MRKKVLVIILFLILILVSNKSVVDAAEHPSYCGSGYGLFQGVRSTRPRDACCPVSYIITAGKVTVDGKCTTLENITLNAAGAFYKYVGNDQVLFCSYQADINKLVLKDQEHLICNGSDGIFGVDGVGKIPVCKLDQCTWESLQEGDVCFEHNQRGCDIFGPGLSCLNLSRFYCCSKSDTSGCDQSPWCEDGCPVDPDPQDPNGDSIDPIQLTCAEICDGERIDIDGDGETDQDGPHYNSCIGCICAGSSDSTNFTGNVWTEVGCITATQEGITVAVMRIFIGIVTGIAVFRFIQAGIMLNTDDPEKIKEGKSIAMSAVAAVVFGALIPILLNFIGLDILGIGRIFE